MNKQARLTDDQPSSPPAVSSTINDQQLPSTSNDLNSSTDSDSAIASEADLPSSTATDLKCLFPLCPSNVRNLGKGKGLDKKMPKDQSKIQPKRLSRRQRKPMRSFHGGHPVRSKRQLRFTQLLNCKSRKAKRRTIVCAKNSE